MRTVPLERRVRAHFWRLTCETHEHGRWKTTFVKPAAGGFSGAWRAMESQAAATLFLSAPTAAGQWRRWGRKCCAGAASATSTTTPPRHTCASRSRSWKRSPNCWPRSRLAAAIRSAAAKWGSCWSVIYTP